MHVHAYFPVPQNGVKTKTFSPQNYRTMELNINFLLTATVSGGVLLCGVLPLYQLSPSSISTALLPEACCCLPKPGNLYCYVSTHTTNIMYVV